MHLGLFLWHGLYGFGAVFPTILRAIEYVTP